MRQRTLLSLLGALLLVLVGPPLLTTGSGAETGTHIPGLSFMVPNTPGGGYDITARTAAKDAEDAGLTHNVEVFNLPGAGGTVGLSRLVNERGNGKLAMSMGLGVVGRRAHQQLPVDAGRHHPDRAADRGAGHRRGRPRTPRTRRSTQLLGAWKADPGKLPVGGGSSPGGPDHLAPHADGAGRRDRPEGRQLRALRRRRRAARRPCSAARSRSASPASASTSTRSRPASCGCSRSPAPKRIAGLRRPDPARRPGWTWSSPTGAASSRRRASREAERDKLIALFDELHDSPQWQEALEQQRLGRRLPDRRRSSATSWTPRTSAWTPC